MKVPPFSEHVAKGAALGAVAGIGIAALGWVIRTRNDTEIDLGMSAPHLITSCRPLAEALLCFKKVSQHSPSTQALYTQLVRDCDFVVQNNDAKGGAQISVQKRISQAVNCAKRLSREAYQYRNPEAHDCRMQIEVLEGHLGSLQKNMMLD